MKTASMIVTMAAPFIRFGVLRYRTVFIIGLMSLLIGCAQSMDDLGGKSNLGVASRDNGFFKMITIANETEIQTSRLALTQSNNESVKVFAQRMIDDHTGAEQQVSSLAADKNVTLPTRLDSEHQRLVDDLKNKTGADFDRAYVQLQVSAHKQTIAADEDEANNGSEPMVRALAGSLLGKLQHHLSMAETLENQIM